MAIRNDSKLKVHIVDAQNLAEGEHSVILTQDKSYAQTTVRTGEAPIWNEAFVFDITNPHAAVQIQLFNENKEVIISKELSLSDPLLREYSQQGGEIWAYAQFD